MCRFQEVELALKAIERGDRETAFRLLRSKPLCALCSSLNPNDNESTLCPCEIQADIETTNLILGFLTK
jgi:hypothetical protein